MLAPIRDYLAPKNSTTSSLLCETKDHYITRLLVEVDPDRPGFEEAGWIVSEDVNVEHLRDTFTSLDASAGDVWDACSNFMAHLYWHKPRKTVLGVKIEGLSDDHPSKPNGLFELSQMCNKVGNHSERKQLLTQALKLEKERGDRPRIAQTLSRLSDANRLLHLYKEGIQHAREALEIYQELGDGAGQMGSLNSLAYILYQEDQLDDAEDAAFHAIDLAPEKGQEFLLCISHRVLGLIYRRKGQKEEAIRHFETAINIASRFKWHDQLFWNHFNLTYLFLREREFDKANTHIEEARSHAVNNTYRLARGMEVQARIWYRQGKLEGAKLEVSRALDFFERFGAAEDEERCRNLLQEWNEQ